MSFTSSEKNKIVQLLGYGGKVIQPGSVIYNKTLNDRLDSIPVDTESTVRLFLGQVYNIELQMNCAPARLAAEKVADITVNLRELEGLRRERKRIAREIAVHLDIPYQGNSASMGVCN